MGGTPATRIEFYNRGGGMIDALRGYVVPRQGEYININQEQWKVAFVSWCVDTERPWGKELRANVELEKVPNDEVGPATPNTNGESK
ncbi:hypothetical protein [Maritalea porphyrae]|uniref:hypothetical protein n=1 Tax=Maritalea porphyrae TaxID=880732 RepID=UPI0022AF9D6E|nr:hypothetical protein [Maritalea porphyrae]MCZ4270785.1 hypothetical protein [Maritalea porphyrae]